MGWTPNSTWKKENIPYLFNTDETADYIGAMPAIDYFAPHLMMPDRAIEIPKWYRLIAPTYNENNPRNNRLELERYCRKDVDVLKACVEAHYRLIYETTGLNPFLYTTSASLALQVFLYFDQPKKRIKMISPYHSKFARRGFTGW
jgi:hypothetical protein